MSTNAAFKLQDAGFTRQQVEALGEFLDTQAATKADLIGSEHRLDARISDLHADLKAETLRLEAKIAETKADLTKTILGAVVLNSVIVLGAMFGLAKLLGH